MSSRIGRALRAEPGWITGSAIFLLIVMETWKAHVISHEMLYLLGSRRVADPTLLAVDFTWSTLPPTTFLFDHILAPLWSFLGEFAIVNVGRFVTGALSAWSLVFLARALRLPAFAVIVGFAAWLAWGQTFVDCGAPFEGFQVKSFAYPLVFFALAFALRGQVVRAGIAAGLGTAFHLIVGGWGCLALFLGMLLDRKRFPVKSLGLFLLSTAPFILPLVLAAGFFHEAGLTKEERGQMDGIYVTIAAPMCCDLDTFMTPRRWIRGSTIFLLAPILVFLWRRRDGSRMPGGFVSALVLFFLAGEVAARLELFSLLKVFPCQLGSSLPALFLFTFLAAWIGEGRPARALGSIVGAVAIVGSLWLLYDRNAFQNAWALPVEFVRELRQPHWGGPPDEPEYGDERLYAWIRANTPRNSVFVTPLVKDFWSNAERAQVASRRHPPFDKRLIEWTDRLQDMNELDLEGDLEATESDLDLEDLSRIRKLYGATHYLTQKKRDDLADRELYAGRGFYVYDLEGLVGSGEPEGLF